ncbi:type VII secretion protein EssC [Paenibacillus sp. N1-5-1-14]|uniref:type VII secretion protein EssC n=1 Tax=Paenibacillus radicibacter TaxID=2972488 RepID=UPI002158F3BB|nr:type VII secretion protein EssC [Paenibacillus radicibacter]MCR8643643.1 type VII secretion protein EssC [Paenibacillus radicibacter]MCR8644757.1 type VII secretion protein EssC [Paenibacillus radicibacter]
MQLSLLKENVVYHCVLPEKKTGQYWITQSNRLGYEERVISVEGVEGEWLLKSNRNAIILDQNSKKIAELRIDAMTITHIHLKKTNEVVILFAEPITEDRKNYQKLFLPQEGLFKIGRVNGCELQYGNRYVSSVHAEMFVTPTSLMIRDQNSSNGTFVNGKRVVEQMLKPGDMIYIIGLKIIVGNGFIAINNPDGQVEYNSNVFKLLVKNKPKIQEELDDFEEEIAEGDKFYRSPRFKRDIEKMELKIDPPPAKGNMEQTPLMLMLGPSITMGMASLFTALYSVQNALQNKGNIMSAAPTLVMSLSMLIGSILWPILARRYEKRKHIRNERIRQEKYKIYIEDVRQEIASTSEYQKQILHENHVTIDNCVSRIKHLKRNLWERTYRQDDFLKISLGIGNLPLAADIKFPEKRFSLDDDHLQEQLYSLAQEPKTLEQVPISLSLLDDWVSGMIGRRPLVIDEARGLILQLTALHSYDELKLVFLYDKKEADTWEFVKWLPHVWSNDKSIRFIATEPSEVKELSVYLEREIAKREHISSDEELREVTPYYVIFAIDKSLSDKAEMMNVLLKKKEHRGFSLIHLYDELKNLPKECSMVVEYNGDVSKIYDKDDISGKHIAFEPTLFSRESELDLAVQMANIQLDTTGASYALPNMLTFLDMFEVSKVEHLNALTRWKDNDPTLSLETPIGVMTTGERFFLDLHEKYHGPHGLIAGMTGSGKSEFIMTFILSLAVNYHPHEVAFILIDYKGGGMANAFTTLPHLAGTITNLDGAAVKRSLVSIQSELKRRQAIFSDTSKMLNISNLDIYKYQKLFRDGQVTEPLQHLFIISDEFAELKTQQPEFMAQLVSAARIGRSLGVHLILATQKPSGVVDDQIWSNSKFRICLKVQERADSMDVIKRPDAAELSVTGRFFVQVGFNELFELGQSAWGGAPYYPSDRIELNKDESITVIDNLGRVVKQLKIDKRKKQFANPTKQLDEVNNYLAAIAKEENIKIRSLWLEPISEFIYLGDVRGELQESNQVKGELNPVIGKFDDPENQSQFPMTFPLTREGNAIIYGAAGSGKTTFLSTLFYSLIEEYTPSELNLYVLDFGSETMRAFSEAPHVGDVLLSHETEKVNNLLKMLYKEVEERKKLFADYGGDYHSYIRMAQTDMAAIVVAIHNYSAFTELYEDKEEQIAYLTREGVKYGIYFILTTLSTSAVRFRLLQNFKQLYVLQLNDVNDYSSVLGNVEGVYPSKFKGRGIMKTDRVYEFQIAHVHEDIEQRFDHIRKNCSKLSESWTGLRARRIPILPDVIDISFFINELKQNSTRKIPIGVEKQSLLPAWFNFEQQYVGLVLSQNNDNTSFVQGLAEVIAVRANTELMVLDPDMKFAPDDSKTYKLFRTQAELDQVVVDLFSTLVSRNNAYKDAIAAGEPAPTFERLTCIIHSFSSLFSSLSDDSKDKLKVLLEKGEVMYQVNFILCERVSSLSSISFENWFKAKVSLNDGIWLGNGISDQYQLKVGKLTSPMYEEIGDGFGYTVTNGKTVLIKLLTSTMYPMEEQ